MSDKIKIRMGMCGVSGTSLMFLSELLDGSGDWETNPGCVSNTLTNEYNGSPHLVYCEEGSEISPRLYNEQSILFCKSHIERFLPYFDCPQVYQIDIMDEQSFQFVFDMRFLKKYLAGDFCMPYAKQIDASGVYEDFIQPYFPYISKYSRPVLDWVLGNKPRDVALLENTLRESYLSSMKNAFQVRYGLIPRLCDIRDLPQSTDINLLDWDYNAEEIQEHTTLHVINYKDLFLLGKDTNTIFDNYKSEIKEYTRINNETLYRFLDDVGL